MKFKWILVFFLCLSVLQPAYPQDATSNQLHWQVEKWFEGHTGIMHEDPGKLITNINGKIQWVAYDGIIIQEYTIESGQGAWYTISMNGAYTWVINDGTLKGTATMERTGNQLLARIILADETEPKIFEFTLTGVQQHEP